MYREMRNFSKSLVVTACAALLSSPLFVNSSTENVPVTWRRTTGIPIPYLVAGLAARNGMIYAAIRAPSNSSTPAKTTGVYTLNPATGAWSKIAPPTGWNNTIGQLLVDSQGRLYTFVNQQKQIWRFDPAQGNQWVRLFNFDLPPDGWKRDGTVWVLGMDDRVYALSKKTADSRIYLVRLSDAGTFEEISLPLPVVAGHGYKNLTLAQRSNGQWIVANGFATTVSNCPTAPTEEPDNQVLRLQGNQWESLNAKPGFNGLGYTCGWGAARLVMQTGDAAIYAFISGRLYLWNDSNDRWTLEDQATYGEDPGYQPIGGMGAVGGRGRFQALTQSYLYRAPNADIESQTCQAVGQNYTVGLAMGLTRVLAVAQLRTRLFDNCTANPADYEIADPQGRTLDELRTINQNNPNVVVDRGLYLIYTNDNQLSSRNLRVRTASYLLSTQGASQAASDVAIQSDGDILIAGRFDGTIQGVPTQYILLNASPTSAGRIVRLTNDGTSIASVTTLGNRIDGIASLSDDRIAVVGDFGLALLSPDASQVLWQRNLASTTDAGQRVKAGRQGQQIITLSNKRVTVWEALNGSTVAEYQFGLSQTTRKVNDVALDDGRNVVYVGGFDQLRNVNDNNNPVQVAFVFAYNTGDLASNTRLWKTWNYNPATLNNDMADTRIYRLTLNADGSKLYALGESAGGNTIYRWDGKDLQTPTLVSSGVGSSSDLWMANSASHISYIGEISTTDGTVVRGQINAAILQSQLRFNTTNARCGIAVDTDGNVTYCGAATAHIPARTSFSIAGQRIDGGMLEGYAGSDPYLLALTPDMRQRPVWTTFSRWRLNGQAEAVAIRDRLGVLVVTKNKGEAITTPNALQAAPGDNPDGTVTSPPTDLYFIVWRSDEILTYTPPPPRAFAPVVRR